MKQIDTVWNWDQSIIRTLNHYVMGFFNEGLDVTLWPVKMRRIFLVLAPITFPLYVAVFISTFVVGLFTNLLVGLRRLWIDD